MTPSRFPYFNCGESAVEPAAWQAAKANFKQKTRRDEPARRQDYEASLLTLCPPLRLPPPVSVALV
jgi:hypothetical protein